MTKNINHFIRLSVDKSLHFCGEWQQAHASPGEKKGLEAQHHISRSIMFSDTIFMVQSS